MKKVLEIIMAIVLVILSLGINLAGIQFFYEAINHLSTETIIGMVLVATSVIGLDSVLIFFYLTIKEEK